MDTEEDIGDISLTQIIRKTAADASVSLFNQRLTVEYYEKAANSGTNWLLYRWAIGQGPKQIARETGHAIEDIYRMLKDLQKAIASDTDTDSHANESVCSGTVLAHKKDLK